MTWQIYSGLCKHYSLLYGSLLNSVSERQFFSKCSIRQFCRLPIAMSADSDRASSDKEKATSKGGPGNPSKEAKNHAEKESNHSQKKLTRQDIVEQERERFLSMTKDERRSHYSCKGKYETLEKVQTWEQYSENVKETDREAERDFRPDLNAKVSIWKCDITKLEIDAIVNAANSSLLGGGGVDGAIHSAAGSSLVAECRTLHGCDEGDAKITAGYKLPAKYVLHTVGPRGAGDKSLISCYNTCLNLMKENDLCTIAFPCIATGIFGFPNDRAARIAISTVRDWLEKDEEYTKSVERVLFCLFLDKDRKFYEEFMQVYFPTEESANGKEDKNESRKPEPESKRKKTSTDQPKRGSSVTKKFTNLISGLKSSVGLKDGNETPKGKKKNSENKSPKKGSEKDTPQGLAATKTDKNLKTEAKNMNVSDNTCTDKEPDKPRSTEADMSKNANTDGSDSKASVEKFKESEVKEVATSADEKSATEGVENMDVNDKGKDKSLSDPSKKERDENISCSDLKTSEEDQIKLTEKQSPAVEEEKCEEGAEMDVSDNSPKDGTMSSQSKENVSKDENTEDASPKTSKGDSRDSTDNNSGEGQTDMQVDSQEAKPSQDATNATQSFKKDENSRL